MGEVILKHLYPVLFHVSELQDVSIALMGVDAMAIGLGET